jgi:hypothetical protein
MNKDCLNKINKHLSKTKSAFDERHTLPIACISLTFSFKLSEFDSLNNSADSILEGINLPCFKALGLIDQVIVNCLILFT